MTKLLDETAVKERLNTITKLLAEWNQLDDGTKKTLEEWNIDVDCMKWHLESVEQVYDRIVFKLWREQFDSFKD
jgi:hypothetical protein